MPVHPAPPLSASSCAIRFANRPRLRLTGCVLSSFIRYLQPRPPAAPEPLVIGSRTVPLRMVCHPRARRYRLRLQADGSARVTIPRGGSVFEARAFVERSRSWLVDQLQKLQTRPPLPAVWLPGTEILFRGATVQVEACSPGRIRFAGETISGPEAGDLRPAIERQLRRLAARELPARVFALAAPHQLAVSRVSVRNQRSRWGSCSRRGTISLNWRLIQMPASVSDYIILHELAHLRHLNHSRDFWAEVERLCPEYRVAEHWLKSNRHRLH